RREHRLEQPPRRPFAPAVRQGHRGDLVLAERGGEVRVQLGTPLLAVRQRERVPRERRAVAADDREPRRLAGDAQRRDGTVLDDRRHQLRAQRPRERPHRLAVRLVLQVVTDRVLARLVDEAVVGVAVDEVEEATERRRRVDVRREAFAEQLELAAGAQHEAQLQDALALGVAQGQHPSGRNATDRLLEAEELLVATGTRTGALPALLLALPAAARRRLAAARLTAGRLAVDRLAIGRLAV